MKAKGIEKLVVTGGASFIGSHTADLLIEHGLAELTSWAKAQGWGNVDLFEKTLKELKERGLAT